MWVAIIVVGVLALGGLCIALGVSLGRDGDRQDEVYYRHQVAEALQQMNERLDRVDPPDDDDDQPAEGPWVR